MRLRKRGIEGNRPTGRLLGLWHGCFRSLESVQPNHVTRIGEPGPSQGIVRIETNGMLKAFCCAEDVRAPSVQQSSTLQVELIRSRSLVPGFTAACRPLSRETLRRSAMAREMSSWTSKMSLSSRSYRSDQRW